MSTFKHFIAWWLVGGVAVILPIPFTALFYLFVITPGWIIYMLMTSRKTTQYNTEINYHISTKDEFGDEKEPTWNL